MPRVIRPVPTIAMPAVMPDKNKRISFSVRWDINVSTWPFLLVIVILYRRRLFSRTGCTLSHGLSGHSAFILFSRTWISSTYYLLFFSFPLPVSAHVLCVHAFRVSQLIAPF